MVSTVGVCSFSREQRNTLMWSHYADGHRGVCLTYELPKSFFDITAKELLGIVPVDYNPLSDWLLQEACTLPLTEFIRGLIKKALTVKADLWKDEKEVRILRWKEGVRVIDKDFLKEICFGLATPDTDISLLRNIVEQCGYKVDLRKVVRNTSNDFGLEPMPYNGFL